MAAASGHANDVLPLTARIDALEQRLVVRRARVGVSLRAFGRGLRRRMTSPISLVFAGSVGFIVAEIVSERSATVRAVAEAGPVRAEQAVREPFPGPRLRPLWSALKFAWISI